MELPAQLKANRERLGLSQEDVAHAIYVSRHTISSWENGKTYPDVQSLLLLSQLFGVTLDEFVIGDPRMEEKIKKDAKDLRGYKSFVLTVSVLCLLFGIVFLVCMFAGGLLKDFCVAACPWVLLGIGVAAGVTFSDQME